MTQMQTESPLLPERLAPTRDASVSGVAGLGLSTLFLFAERAPWLLRLLKPIAVRGAIRFSSSISLCVRENARVIFGRELATDEARVFNRAVVANFYDFVLDVGRSGAMSARELRERIESVHGIEGYHAARAAGRGALFVTAHMGAFEVGLAALREWEPKVHVVFKRDSFGGFERIRSRVRAMLGVTEAPIDEGFGSLVQLRDALLANEVVVMQGDRAMPGQRAQVVPFLHGHLRLPLGPVKLAQLTGSPIIPVFLVRGERGGFHVHLTEPIEVDGESEPIDGVDPALRRIAQAIESFVKKYPQQWLVLNCAFVSGAAS